MYITSQQSYLSQINVRQTSVEACFDSKRRSRDYSRDSDLTNVIFYCIEHFKRLFTEIITGELTNSPWHLYQKCFVGSLHIDDFR